VQFLFTRFIEYVQFLAGHVISLMAKKKLSCHTVTQSHETLLCVCVFGYDNASNDRYILQYSLLQNCIRLKVFSRALGMIELIRPTRRADCRSRESETACWRMTRRTHVPKSGKNRHIPFKWPHLRQNQAYLVIFCTLKLLPVLHFCFRFCDRTLQITENDLSASRTCKQGLPNPFMGILGYLHLSASIIMTKTTILTVQSDFARIICYQKVHFTTWNQSLGHMGKNKQKWPSRGLYRRNRK